MSSEKLEQAIAEAYAKAYNIVRSNSGPEVHPNAIAVAASNMTLVLLEIDLDDD